MRIIRERQLMIEMNRWLLELTTEILMKTDSNEVKEIRWGIIRDMACYQTSGPGRNYLLSYWLEEKYDIENKGGGNFSDIIMGRPMMWCMKTLPFHVDPVKCNQMMDKGGIITGIIELIDIGEIYRLRLKELGVMQLTVVNSYDVGKIDWILKTSEKMLKHILTDDKGDKKKEEKRGHLIPRMRTGSAGLIAVLFGIISGKDSNKNGLIKGKRKAIQFFQCLEFKTISKL